MVAKAVGDHFRGLTTVRSVPSNRNLFLVDGLGYHKQIAEQCRSGEAAGR